MERLSRHVDAYSTWKLELIRQVDRYSDWLARNRLGTPSLDETLARCRQILREDTITLAFAGEFSRGKTELINALFFADYGQRMLPSQAGRTTMCPTELFYDADADAPYIRLLPIESRLDETAVAEWRSMPEQWTQITLDYGQPESMAAALKKVAETQTVSLETALALGFDAAHLDRPNAHDQVEIPAWRHAIIHFDHPLLRQGLRILDTPGLNALGSEPELTLSMLPSAQAILFLLAADAGVTASDLQLWEQHIKPTRGESADGLFAILNKIDTLWDDLNGEDSIEQSILRVRETTARQLGISTADVLPLSAKQALLGKVRAEPELLQRSHLAALEHLLCERIIGQKEKLLQNQVINQVIALLASSQSLLTQRLEEVRQQYRHLDEATSSSAVLAEQIDRTREEHAQYHKRLLNLRTTQRMLQGQAVLLSEVLNPARMERHLTDVRHNLAGSWTTLGISEAIHRFFQNIEHDMLGLYYEGERANKVLQNIYQRHNEENPAYRLEPPRLRIKAHIRSLRQLQLKADHFRKQMKTFFTEQRVLTRRFFATLVKEVVHIHEETCREAKRWNEAALLPLIQFTREHKQLLEANMLELKSLTQQTLDQHQQKSRLAAYCEALESQCDEANDILRQLRRPAPVQRQAKVVALPGVSFA
ncbi:replication fork clamp-binding protein CrfC [Pseudomonas duriflava]|uniref:Replication fork clamp-binding protein CrfC n=1 Tax=Pseudomonas duriflava TaxID=459528 RepID=A0A562QQB4_9PSED|nr:dynamin family protein [Pseudomonas duriflava]TWI58390.1 replication fork clamp-binding protein CrfC [Pseudomonas duriflava]